MTKSIFKSILAGVLIGTALFLMPFFLLNMILVVLLLGAAFRLFSGGRMQSRRVMYAEYVRKMTEDEFAQFKQGTHKNCRNREYHEYTEIKTH